MPSQSLRRWRSDGLAALDELDSAHRAVGGSGRGRRFATQQVNRAYAVVLSSRFQAFCRDLHTEVADHFVAPLAAAPALEGEAIRDILHTRFIEGRKLDRGNPNEGHLGSDFGRFGLSFKRALRGSPVRAQVDRDLVHLRRLNLWRNAISHQDFTRSEFVIEMGNRDQLRISEARTWRAACNRLAGRMDAVLCAHLERLLGSAPW